MLDLYQSHRITVDNTPGETALTINDVNRRDGGMYVCVAKNSLGRIKQTAKLIVSGKSKIIFKNSRILSTLYSVTLTYYTNLYIRIEVTILYY